MMTIPFFVADRPMSLRLLKGLPLREHSGVLIGIMAHANTTANFRRAFHEYPCDNLDYCDAVGGPCLHQDDQSQCAVRQYILAHTVKMCDSGIFTREGATLTHDQLFDLYAHMDVDYGIMIDVFQNAQATLESAKEALQAYKPYKSRFKLVGVAHGDSADSYLACYEVLKRMGFEYIAIGGLLRRRVNTVRFPYVGDEDLMLQVLRELRRRYPGDWLFALGCLHPTRLQDFMDLGVWADYKGWIFQYEKRNKTLVSYLEEFAVDHVSQIGNEETVEQLASLRRLIVQHGEKIARHDTLNQQLIDGRRTLRALLNSLLGELETHELEMVNQFKFITTHTLLDGTEEKIVKDALRACDMHDSKISKQILDNVQKNRKLRTQIKRVEGQLDRIAGSIAELTEQMHNIRASAPMHKPCERIVQLIQSTERDHRFEQVRSKISSAILTPLQEQLSQSSKHSQADA